MWKAGGKQSSSISECDFQALLRWLKYNNNRHFLIELDKLQQFNFCSTLRLFLLFECFHGICWQYQSTEYQHPYRQASAMSASLSSPTGFITQRLQIRHRGSLTQSCALTSHTHLQYVKWERDGSGFCLTPDSWVTDKCVTRLKVKYTALNREERCSVTSNKEQNKLANTNRSGNRAAGSADAVRHSPCWQCG